MGTLFSAQEVIAIHKISSRQLAYWRKEGLLWDPNQENGKGWLPTAVVRFSVGVMKLRFNADAGIMVWIVKALLLVDGYTINEVREALHKLKTYYYEVRQPNETFLQMLHRLETFVLQYDNGLIVIANEQETRHHLLSLRGPYSQVTIVNLSGFAEWAAPWMRRQARQLKNRANYNRNNT